MEVLINRLNKYFLTNKTLENFSSIFKKTLNEIKINLRIKNLDEKFFLKIPRNVGFIGSPTLQRSGNERSERPLDFKNDLISGTYSKKRLFFNKKYEIIFITWEGNCESPIHSHPNNGCLLIVLDGDLIEERYDHAQVIYKYSELKRGDFGYMHCDLGKHKIINPNDYNSYSLHIYSPPGFYDCKSK